MTALLQINGLGLVGGFGCGKAALLAALAQGCSPLRQVDLRAHQLALFQADTAPLENYLNKRALRRIDHFSRLALLGAFQALEDAGQPTLDRSRLGVVIGSGFGALTTTFHFLDSVIEDGDACASPTAFSNSVHNAAAAHISMQLQITGPSLTVSQFDQSLGAALLGARQWLAEGRVDAVLLGVVDEYCSVLGYCWERYFGSGRQGPMRPFDFSRFSAIPGEGAAFFLLQAGPAGGANYAGIEGLELGRLAGSRPQLPAGQPLLLGCEGVPRTGLIYGEQLAGTHPLACYSPLYGAAPVTPGFDLAVAALSLARGELFPSADDGGAYGPQQVIGEARPCRRLTCLKYGLAGDYAAIHLRAGG
jgi:3-oxoacyl-[acyl-carrier-protein] synthase II